MPEISRHTKRSEKAIRLLDGVRAPLVKSDGTSLGDILEAGAETRENEIMQAIRTGNSLSDIKTEVHLHVGGPGVGKTHTVEQVVLPFHQAFARRIWGRYGVRLMIIHTSWDRDLTKLIRNGFIQPKSDGSLPPEGIHLNSSLHEANIAYGMGGDKEKILFGVNVELARYRIAAQVLRDAFACVTTETAQIRESPDPKTFIEETVAGTSSIVPSKLGSSMRRRRWLPQTRPYNNKLAHNLIYGEGSFGEIADYRVGARVGFIAGLNMDVYARYRGLIQTLRTLAEVNNLNELLGFPLFASQEEWEKRKIGASPASVTLAHLKMAATARIAAEMSDPPQAAFLSESKHFPELDDPVYRRAVSRVASLLGLSRDLIAWRQRQKIGEANVLAQILGLDDLTSSPGAIVENNPPLALSRRSQDKLRKIFATIYA